MRFRDAVTKETLGEVPLEVCPTCGTQSYTPPASIRDGRAYQSQVVSGEFDWWSPWGDDDWLMPPPPFIAPSS